MSLQSKYGTVAIRWRTPDHYCRNAAIATTGIACYINSLLFHFDCFHKFSAGTLLLAFALFVSLALLKIHLTSNGPGRSVSYPYGQTIYQENLFMTTVHRGHKTKFWEAPLPKCSALINTTSLESNQNSRWHDRLSHLEKYEIKLLKDDPVCLKNICPNTSFCFLGACFCHPGYEGEECSSRKIPGNPWYTESCPNLLSTSTADMTVPLHMLGGEYSQANYVPEEGSGENSSFSLSVPVRNKCVGSSNPTACAYLCYSHAAYGTAVVPHSLWQAAQDAEGDLFDLVMMVMVMIMMMIMMVIVMIIVMMRNAYAYVCAYGRMQQY
jgi:hypothetical protein